MVHTRVNATEGEPFTSEMQDSMVHTRVNASEGEPFTSEMQDSMVHTRVNASEGESDLDSIIRKHVMRDGVVCNYIRKRLSKQTGKNWSQEGEDFTSFTITAFVLPCM